MTTTSFAGPHTEEVDARLELAMRKSHQTRGRARRRRHVVILVAQVGIVVAVLGTWEILARKGSIDPLFFSSPSRVWDALRANFQVLMDNAAHTLEATLVGFALSAVGGIVVGILFAWLPAVSDALQPIITFLNSLPRIAFVPLFILWFGITFNAKVATAFSLVFFIVLINTHAGLTTVDRELLLVTRLLGGTQRQVYFKVAIPAAVPAIFAGLRLGITYSILGVVASEMVASRNGLGQLITLYGQNLDSAGVFATLAVLGAIATIISFLLGLIERRLSRWRLPAR